MKVYLRVPIRPYSHDTGYTQGVYCSNTCACYNTFRSVVDCPKTKWSAYWAYTHVFRGVRSTIKFFIISKHHVIMWYTNKGSHLRGPLFCLVRRGMKTEIPTMAGWRFSFRPNDGKTKDWISFIFCYFSFAPFIPSQEEIVPVLFQTK